MSSTDFRQLSTKELHLYMNLVMGFCKDIRRMLREGTLTKDAIDKYEVTVSNNILTEVNRRSGAEGHGTLRCVGLTYTRQWLTSCTSARQQPAAGSIKRVRPDTSPTFPSNKISDRSRLPPPRGILRIRITVKASEDTSSGALLIPTHGHAT